MKNILKPMDSFCSDKLLTLVAIDGANKQMLDSFGELSYSLIEVKEYKNIIKVGTAWKMFLYKNEKISADLREALPIFLNSKLPFDFYSLYRKGNSKNGITKYSLSPRIFKSNVELKLDCVYPKSFSGLTGETILNGFILEQE